MATQQPNSRIGFLMPVEFNSAMYESIHARVDAHRSPFPNEYSNFVGGFRAVAYRFRSCADHSGAFTESFRHFGAGPELEERYVQERELFCFFVSGITVVESFCYSLFALAAMVDSINFPMGTNIDKKNITPNNTRDRLIKSPLFATEGITLELDKLLGYPKRNPPVNGDLIYEEWDTIRNVLAHRIVPSRSFYMSTVGSSKPPHWKEPEIVIDDQTTDVKYKWLSQTLDTLLEATDKFSAKYL